MTSPESFIDAASESRDFVARTGSLPEIEAAAVGLHYAFDRTRTEIAEATFARRYSTKMTGALRDFTESITPIPAVSEAIEEEGEAGFLRHSLESRRQHLESELASLIHGLTELRTELALSQDEF